MANIYNFSNHLDAPSFASVSFDMPIEKISSGIGLNSDLEANGWVNFYKISLSYSYIFNFEDSKLVLGIAPTYTYNDYTQLSFVYFAGGHSISPESYDIWAFKLGSYFEKQKFYIGISMFKGLEEITISDYYGSRVVCLPTIIYLNSGYDFNFKDSKFSFTPSMLAKSDLSVIELSFLGMIGYNDVVKLGVNYTYNRDLTPMVEFKLFDALTLGYGYGIYLSRLGSMRRWNHEFLLKYSFNK